MSDYPIRTQGGIFIWICALFAVASALITLRQSYDGFWEFLLACVLAAGIAYVVHCLIGKLIARRLGGIDGERGPLVGLVCVATSNFLGGYYTQLRDNAGESSYFTATFRCALGAILIAYMLLLVGRGLNRHDMRVDKGRICSDWMGMADQAQTACLVIIVPAMAAASMSIVEFFILGARLMTWAVLGKSLFIAGLSLSLFAMFREGLLKFLFSNVPSKFPSRYIPKTPGVIWEDSFTLGEYCASLAGSGVAGIVFIFCPRFLQPGWPCILVVLGAILIGFLALIMTWYFDWSHLTRLFHGHWRAETIACLKARHVEHLDRHRMAVMNNVITALMETVKEEWDDLCAINGVADRFRKMWNLRFCEDGSMKYISGWVISDRRHAVERHVKELFDSDLCQHIFDKDGKAFETMKDEILLAKASEEASRYDGAGDAIEVDTNACVGIISAKLDWSCIKPTCCMNLEFRRGGRDYKFSVEIDENGDAVLSHADSQEEKASPVFKYDRLDEALERYGIAI